MSSVTDLGEIVGKRLTEDLPGKLAQRAAVIGLSAGARLTFPSEEGPFSKVDVDDPLFHGDGYSTSLLAAGKYAKQPELFWGPLPQVGTFLKGKGVIENDWLALGLDILIDPTNLIGGAAVKVGAKTGGGVIKAFTESRSIARIATAVRGGDEALSGAELVGRVHQALDAASKISGVKGEIAAAAKAGNSKAIAEIVGKALKSGSAQAEDVPMLAAMLKDRKTLGNILDNTSKVLGLGKLPAATFEGRGLLEHVASIRPKITIPSANPLSLTRQLMGFSAKGDTYWIPGAAGIAGGLERAVAGGAERTLAGNASELRVEEARVGKLMQDAELEHQLAQRDMREARASENQAAVRAAEGRVVGADRQLALARTSRDELRDDVAAGLFEADVPRRTMPVLGGPPLGIMAGRGEAAVSSGLSAYNSTVGMSILRVIAGSEQDQLFRDLGAEGLKQVDLQARYRQLRSLSPATEVLGTPGFETYTQRLTDRYTGIQRAYDQARVRRFNETVDEATASLQTLRPQLESAIRSGALDEGFAEQLPSMLRRIHDDFGIRALVRDAAEPGMGIPTRQSFAALIARQTVVNTRDIIHQGYKGPLMREFAAEVFGPAIAHPELFEEVAGRLVLKATPDEVKAASPFLHDALQRSLASPKSRELEAGMRGAGLDPGLSYVIKQAQATFEATGKTLLSEGVIQGTVHGYFPRVFTPNAKFFEKFGGSEADLAAAMERMLGSDVSDEILKGMMKGLGVRAISEKARQGKLSMAEARRWTELLAQRMEAGGYGKYNKDGVALLGGYMEAAHSALMMNRLLHDLPQIAGPIVEGEIKDATRLELAGVRRVMLIEPDSATGFIQKHFTRVDPRYRSEPATRDTAALAEKAIASEATGRGLGRDFAAENLAAPTPGEAVKRARRLTAEKYHNATEVGGTVIKLKGGRKVRNFNKNWYIAGRIPESLENWKGIKSFLDKEAGELAMEISPKAAAKAGARRAQESVATVATKTAGRVVPGKELWVYTPEYRHLQDALHLYNKGADTPSWLRKYREWNYRIKSTLLAVDIFHYNVLAFSQLLSDPASVLKIMASAQGIQRAGVGAAIGGAVGVASDRDEEGVLGMTLAGALYGLAIKAASARAGAASHLVMNPQNVDTLYWMGRGGWTGRPDDRAIGILGKGLKAMRDGLARDATAGIVKTRIHPIDRIRHISDGWDKQLWEVMHNGSKHVYFDHVFRKEVLKLEASKAFQPDALKAEFTALKNSDKLPQGMESAGKFVLGRQDAMRTSLAREVVQTTNNLFGGQTWRYLLDHPEYQKGARDFLLAPDWTASRLAMAVGYMMNMGPIKRAALGAGIGAAVDYVAAGGDPHDLHTFRAASLGAGMGLALGKWADGIQRRMATKGDVMRKEAIRLSAAALLGGYTMANVLNHAFTGHFMWDNEEGRRTQINLGDDSYVALGKPWVEAFEFAGVYHPDRYPSPFFSRAFSKGAPVPRAIFRVFTNTNDFGGAWIVPEDSPLDLASKYLDFTVQAVMPIGLQGPSRLLPSALEGDLDQRQLQAAAVRGVGFQVSTPRATPRLDLSGLLGSRNPPDLGNAQTPFRFP